MKIQYIAGDLLDTEAKYILHGCNAQGVMGSGVAKAIRAKYPSAYDVYREQFRNGLQVLGAVSYATQDDGITVFNGITQEFYGRDGKQYVSYEAVEIVISTVDKWMRYCGTGWKHVAMPKIGAGLGGGDWNVISEIIEENSIHFQPVVYSLEAGNVL